METELKCDVCGKKIKDGDKKLIFTWHKKDHIFCSIHARSFNRLINKIDVYLPMMDEMDDMK